MATNTAEGTKTVIVQVRRATAIGGAKRDPTTGNANTQRANLPGEMNVVSMTTRPGGRGIARQGLANRGGAAIHATATVTGGE